MDFTKPIDVNNTHACVYQLIQNDVVVYVGMTAHIHPLPRIKQHVIGNGVGQVRFDSYRFVVLDNIEQALDVARQLIIELDPEHNVQHTAHTKKKIRNRGVNERQQVKQQARVERAGLITELRDTPYLHKHMDLYKRLNEHIRLNNRVWVELANTPDESPFRSAPNYSSLSIKTLTTNITGVAFRKQRFARNRKNHALYGTPLPVDGNSSQDYIHFNTSFDL